MKENNDCNGYELLIKCAKIIEKKKNSTKKMKKELKPTEPSKNS